MSQPKNLGLNRFDSDIRLCPKMMLSESDLHIFWISNLMGCGQRGQLDIEISGA